MREPDNEPVNITVFTDPLCCWSWAFEEQLQQLKKTLAERVTWEYRMAGLIPSWDNFHDQTNSVSRPAQMGPVWMHAGQVAQKPVYHQIWAIDPPASSYPACIAVKCAQLQSSEAAEQMLQLLREACMMEGKNIARRKVLFEVAEKLTQTEPAFNFSLFEQEYSNDKGLDAFRSDLQLVAYYRINRFPALVIQEEKGKALIIAGYRPYKEIINIIQTNLGSGVLL